MNKIDKSQIDINGIGNCISQGRLKVPRYQRSYSWEEKQVSDLLNDIHSAILEKKQDYFLGSIVLLKTDDNYKEIVDGQQRIATTSIILAAIRNQFSKLKDEKRANLINKNYLFSEDIDTLDLIPNLQLNLEDDPFFSDFILKANKDASTIPKTSRKHSHQKIEIALKKAEKYIKDHVASSDTLLSWVKYIRENVKIIWIEVEDTSYAYTIFETLNDRGMDLTVSDLLKNLLFSKSGTYLEPVQNNWVQMINTLEPIDRGSLIVDFIRHFWASLYGLTREKELYSKMRETVKSNLEAKTLSEELLLSSYLYSAILNPEHDLWDSYDDNTRFEIGILKMLNMQQNRPLIIAVLSKFNAKEVSLTIKNLVNWAIRFNITSRLGSAALENTFAEAAMLVSQSEIKKLPELLEHMKTIIPTDKEFSEAFETASISRSEMASSLSGYPAVCNQVAANCQEG